MKHRQTKVSKFNRTPAARKALMLGLARSLFIHEKIETTLDKAKAVRPEAEKMLTIAKTNTLANRRRLISKLQDKELVEKLLSDIGPRLGGSGGYTRIQRSFIRKGDMTQMAVLSLVDKKAKEEIKTSADKDKKEKADKKLEQETDVKDAKQVKAEKMATPAKPMPVKQKSVKPINTRPAGTGEKVK